MPALLHWRVVQTPRAEAYRRFDPAAGRWTRFSWQGFDEHCEPWRNALAAEGFERGARIAILMPNGIEHIAMDQAALSRGHVPVPLHAVDNPDSVVYILRDCGASLLLVDSVERWQSILAAGDPGDQLKRVVCATNGVADLAGNDRRIVALDSWLQSGAGARPREVAVRPDDLAAIVYTSGTTGRPKGVMLSHDNILSDVKACARRMLTGEHDVLLSFLPLSHTFERTVGYYGAIAAGGCVAYARSVRLLPEDLKEVRPTVLVSVPRIYERVYAKVMEHRARAGRLDRTLLDLTLSVGSRRFEARQQRTRVSMFDRLAWPLLKALVADKVLGEFGGRLRLAVSGGAPIAEPVIRLFLALGLDLLQGYGMTETSPVVCVNLPDDNDPRSVGRALESVEVKLSDDQELLIRGATVMMGYWGKPEETLRVKGGDGWLHSGDRARFENGRIFITGRIKDILVTSTGEKIAPVDLETAILADPLFEQAMVVGDNRPFLAVLAVLNPRAWETERSRLAAAVTAGDPSAAQSAFLIERIAGAVKMYPAYATPRAVWWSTEPWTIEAGLLTPTLKNKRGALERRFADEIAALYAKRPQGAVTAAGSAAQAQG